MRTEFRYRGPLCTTRWPTASTPRIARTVAESAVSSSLPSATSNSFSLSTVSSSTRLTLRELEPALSTRPGNELIRQGPVANFGRVLAVVACVLPVTQPLVDHHLTHVRGLGAQRGHSVDHVHHEMKSIEVVEHDHVERSRGRPLFFIPAHVKVVVIGAPVGEAVDQPGIPVIGEDHRPVFL